MGHHSCVRVLVVIRRRWLSVLFVCRCRSQFITVCRLCPSSPVVCRPVLFHVVTWWQAFPLGGGDVVGARCHVSWLGYDRGGIEGLTLAIKRR